MAARFLLWLLIFFITATDAGAAAPEYISAAERGAPASVAYGLAASNAAFKSENAVVAELFTSQGCSSCPPAEAFMRELSLRDDVLTFEYHVNYWDDLATPAGRWKDPYSSDDWTRRQKDYNEKLAGSSRVFTPQIVVDGQFQDVGSHKKSITEMVEQAKVLRRLPAWQVTPVFTREGGVTVGINGRAVERPLAVMLVRFHKRKETRVVSGENGGETLVSFNIVTSLMPLGAFSGGKKTLKVSAPPFTDGEGCAVLLQDPENMRIFAARFCSL